MTLKTHRKHRLTQQRESQLGTRACEEENVPFACCHCDQLITITRLLSDVVCDSVVRAHTAASPQWASVVNRRDSTPRSRQHGTCQPPPTMMNNFLHMVQTTAAGNNSTSENTGI